MGSYTGRSLYYEDDDYDCDDCNGDSRDDDGCCFVDSLHYTGTEP